MPSQMSRVTFAPAVGSAMPRPPRERAYHDRTLADQRSAWRIATRGNAPQRARREAAVIRAGVAVRGGTRVAPAVGMVTLTRWPTTLFVALVLLGCAGRADAKRPPSAF